MTERQTLKVLVTGASGQLGGELMREDWPDSVVVTGRTRRQLDITDPVAVEAEFRGGNYCVVVNAAAYTAVDRAETERELAFSVNEIGPANLARVCATHHAALIHLSTDYVFDGTKPASYTETDPVNPVSVYGKSKYAGEDAVRKNLDEHLILRTAWVYASHGNNFVGTILRLAAEREELRIVSDQYGNPTSAADLARAIISIVDRYFTKTGDRRDFPWGTYNCTNSDQANWFEFAKAVVDLAASKLGKAPKIEPISTADYPTLALRPANSRLACDRLERTFDIRMRSWKEALEPVVHEMLLANRPEVICHRG